MGTGGFFWGIWRPVLEHSPLSSPQVRNGRSYNSTPPMCVDGLRRDNFTFIFYAAEIRTSYLPNTGLQLYRCTNAFGQSPLEADDC